MKLRQSVLVDPSTIPNQPRALIRVGYPKAPLWFEMLDNEIDIDEFRDGLRALLNAGFVESFELQASSDPPPCTPPDPSCTFIGCFTFDGKKWCTFSCAAGLVHLCCED